MRSYDTSSAAFTIALRVMFGSAPVRRHSNHPARSAYPPGWLDLKINAQSKENPNGEKSLKKLKFNPSSVDPSTTLERIVQIRSENGEWDAGMCVLNCFLQELVHYAMSVFN